MKTTDLYDYKGVAVVIYLHSYTIIHIHMVKLCAEDARAVGDGPGGEGVGRGGSEEALLEGGGTVAEALLEGRVHRRSGVVLDSVGRHGAQARVDAARVLVPAHAPREEGDHHLGGAAAAGEEGELAVSVPAHRGAAGEVLGVLAGSGAAFLGSCETGLCQTAS